MTAQPNSNDFRNIVLKLADEVQPFQPHAAYDRDGDCIEFITSNDDYYAERIDRWVTVYYSRDTGEVIGSLVKNVRSLCSSLGSQMPGFAIEIHDGSVKLKHLFTAQMWSAGDKINVVVYRKLRDAADETNAEVEMAYA